ncbi:hypothetical protein GH714_033157 [Hevea brasiliensis]|uniref:NB-ARC domain-containing protein n=1 Tax=Hevea brasiliensis TaxID=3981 RepID=A0A6A6M2K2_HEVBR|nr:hypothetical protein GH714_033157 [Hevea brasiliensis]
MHTFKAIRSGCRTSRAFRRRTEGVTQSKDRGLAGDAQDVLYDAEDVVDEFECEALRRKAVKSGNTTRKVRRFFSSSNPLAFRFRMGHKLKHIKEREREMTHSIIDASNVIGREQARDNVIETLLRSVDGENVSIIPIVGIGGIGKTTLAKLVYNDQRIVTHFDLKLWVCVSDSFELDKVIIKIPDSTPLGQ